MAKRSDLAQKLLDDLRLRKERMGMATAGQHSAQRPSTGNAYGNSRRAFRGSGEATSSRSSNKNIPSTDVIKMWLSARHHRAPSFEGTSQDIIPVGRTRNKQSIDVSMALALALSNTGKLQNIELFSNATMGKNLILHRGSLNFREIDGNMPRTSGQFPFLSPLQIGEISKGVQQLNMILRACSNGIIFSRDSIDIGRELLKGAIDLEESLRMLVSLQDASDYMAGSQGKQIKLLKGKEDESSSEEVNNRKLMKPRFSFDRTSKHSHQHVREGSNSDLIETLMTPKSNSNKSSSNASLQFSYHRRSLSNGPGSRSDAQFLGHANETSHSNGLRGFSKDGNCTTSTNVKHSGSKGGSGCEKVRIPNVVAKLMGLEELPLEMPDARKIEVQNVPNPKHIKGSSKIKTDVEISKKEGIQMTYSAPKMKGQNMVIEDKGIAETKAVNILEADRTKKKNTKELTNPEHKNPASSVMFQVSISKEMDMASMDHCKEFKVAKKEATEARVKVSTMQQIHKEKVEQGAIEKPTREHGTLNTASLLHGNSEDTVRKHEKAQRKKDVIPTQQRNTQVTPTAPQQQSAIHRLKTKQTVYKNGDKVEHNKRNKLQSIISKKKEVKLKNAEVSPSDMKTEKVSSSTSTTTVPRSLINFSDTKQPKEYPKVNHNEQKKLQGRKFAYHDMDRKSENGISEEKWHLKEVAKTEKGKSMPLIPARAIRKPVPNSSAQKVEITNLMRGRNENRGILVEENRRMKTTEAKVQNLKQKTSFLHELEHRWKERTGKAEVIISSHAMKPKHDSQQTVLPTNLLCSSEESEIPSLSQIITEETIVEAQQEQVTNPGQSHDTTITDSASLHPPEICVKEDLELQPLLEEDKSKGAAGRSQPSIGNSSGWKNLATSEVHGQGLLTKDENVLKQILMSSQHFLNTAQAVFKIKIPIGVLQASKNISQNEGDKLVLDTGYELMTRKGRREEALFSKKISFVPAKVRCLDDLIKELKNDLRSLEMPSNAEDANNDMAEYLHKMIEQDIQNRNPDINCMWDICWDSMTFANIEKEEIIRDVEKHVLNGLINDLARDLMSVSISI